VRSAFHHVPLLSPHAFSWKATAACALPNLLEETRERDGFVVVAYAGSEVQADCMRRWRELPRPCKKTQERGTLELQIERPGHPSVMPHDEEHKRELQS